MKIWYQSSSSYGYEPVFDTYGKTVEEQCRRVLRPDTAVHVAGIPYMVRDVGKYKSMVYYQKVESINNMYKAQREGYDAFVIGCTLDIGLDEAKSLLDMPVVGISEVNYHLAMMMGRLFAIVTTLPHLCQVFDEQMDKYGLSSRYLRGPYCFTTAEEDLARGLKDPEPIMKRFRATAAKAVADGASALIPSPAFLAALCYKTGLTRVEGALVIDTVGVAVKTAEMLVELKKIGIGPSRVPGVYAQPGVELLREALAGYKPLFKIDY